MNSSNPSRRCPPRDTRWCRPFRLAGIVSTALALLPVALPAASLTASLDRDTIFAGETANFSLAFEGGVPQNIPAPPAAPGLVFTHIGQSTQITFVNGRRSSSLTYNYLLRAAQPGDYVIPAISVAVDGTTLTSLPVKLKVLKQGETAPEADLAGKAAFLKLVVPKSQIYLGEVLPLEIRLYALHGRLVQAPQISQEGFTVGKMVQQQTTRTIVNNQYYNMAVFKSFVIGAKTGQLKLGPATLLLKVPHPQTRVDFWGEPLAWMDLTLQSDGTTIDVLPLPADNVPRDFTGAVGNYSLSATASTNTVTVGDPITLTVQIAGQGPIESLILSSIEHWKDFKTYPPVTKVETSDQFGLQGVKTFEQVVVPDTPQLTELPPIAFSFFDPDKKAYRTVVHPATPITVRPSTAPVAQPTVVAGTGQNRDEANTATDIVHIKTRPGTLAHIRPTLIQQAWFLVLQGVPLLAWIGAVVWRRREEKLAHNPRLRRRREVDRTIRDGLAELRRLAAGNQSEEFFATVFRLLQERLGERLDLPAFAITEAVIEERLSPRGTPADTLASVHELFQVCNQARYAPQRTSRELASLIPKVERALGDLQRIQSQAATP